MLNRGFAPTAGAVAARCSSQTTKEDVMSEQNKDLVRRYYDQVINGRDLAAVGDYFADQRVAGLGAKGLLPLLPSIS
jgi:hypothetical protein